jgi:hypothetical protein
MATMSHPALQERRLARSSDALLSLCRLLESARRRSALPALALADASGCLVAGSGASRVCEELAAIAALPSEAERRAALASDGAEPTVFRWLLQGVELSLAAYGPASNELWQSVAEGCRRILAGPAATPA